MKYSEALDYIEECNKLGSVPGLDSIRELCTRLGNPQDKLKFIHIAGTNGKGSTLAYISTILQCNGHKVGRYVSPTIRTYLERFQVNGRQMSQKDFAEYILRIKKICEEITADGLPHPTSFEIETAIAFWYFVDKGCDIVVLECGMGGKLDATNLVTTTQMEVFAHIDMDHMQFLGETLTDIAKEKSGIIKPHTVVVSTAQEDEVAAVLREACDKNEASFSIVKEDEISKVKYSLKGQSFVLADEDDKKSRTKFVTPLLGTHQIANAALAVKAMRLYGIEDDIIARGLLETVWPARLQILSKKPLIVVDGAHNPDAARRLAESLDIYFKDVRKIFIYGMFRDKSVEETCAIMCPKADMVLTVATPGNPRAMSSVELAKVVSEYNGNVTSLDSVEEALEMARMFADDKTLILAWGSLSYLGRVMDIVENNTKKGR